MSDLERLWDDLPVSPAPVAGMIRAGRAKDRPARRRLLRPAFSLGALAALGGAFLAGSLVTGPPATGPQGGTPPPGGDAVPAAYFGELEAAASCDELLDFYVDRGLDLVGPYGWDPYYYGGFGGVSVADSANVSAYAAPASQRAENGESGTNVQESGVDEPDVVKTDGELLVRIDEGELTTYDVTGATTEQLAVLDLGDFEDGEILLVGDRVIALGNDGTRERDSYDYGQTSPMTRVLTIGLADPAAPEVVDTMDFDSSLITARLHGDSVRLVTAAGLPALDFVEPGRGNGREGGEQTALEANRDLVRETSISDWLPTGSVDGGTDERLAECEDVALPKDDLGLDTMSVVGFDAADPTSWEVTALAADASLTYASADHLYLATPAFSFGGCFELCVDSVGGPSDEDGTTHVFDFELTETGTAYRGAGEVDGMVQDRWAMDEYDGTLRLAVSPTQQTGNFNSVVTMRLEGDELVEVGRVDKLGENETIQSVRWFDGLAIVVTFRQVDPLYAIDLTDAAAPRLMGELKIPGFSEYLHPLGSDRLIGMGQGPTGDRGQWGAQAGLFNVSDLTDPKQKQVVSYAANTMANAGVDPRQFTWLPSKKTVLTVISKGYESRTGWVSVLTLDDGEMTNRMVEAEYGADVDNLRLVPLPDGRVVLVTGDGVEFFDV
ncbi:MAG: beta-propeller domain-containing protein [Nocardioides sp.]